MSEKRERGKPPHIGSFEVCALEVYAGEVAVLEMAIVEIKPTEGCSLEALICPPMPNMEA